MLINKRRGVQIETNQQWPSNQKVQPVLLFRGPIRFLIFVTSTMDKRCVVPAMLITHRRIRMLIGAKSDKAVTFLTRGMVATGEPGTTGD
jgi:hypothetical protein